MTLSITPETEAAAAAYIRTIDPENYTTRRPLTVGRATTVHALDEAADIWGIKVGRIEEGSSRTYAVALCGTQSPSYNRNHARKLREDAVEVDCKKCKRVMDNMAANRKAKAAEAAAAAEAEAATAPVEEIAPEAPAAVETEALKFEDLSKGDKVRTLDGREWTITQPALDKKTCWVRPAEGGKPVRRAWKGMTKLS